MTRVSHGLMDMSLGTAAVLAAVLLASCASQDAAPVQVASNTPSVTYNYSNDQQLLQVEQSATTYCNQYRAVPQAIDFSDDPDGSKAVIFNCVQETPEANPPIQANSNLTYTYGTDAELLGASRNAQTYCMNNDQSSQVSSNITPNEDGTNTVTFQCGEP